MRQAIIWTNADIINWRMHAALGGGELKGMQIATNNQSILNDLRRI